MCVSVYVCECVCLCVCMCVCVCVYVCVYVCTRFAFYLTITLSCAATGDLGDFLIVIFINRGKQLKEQSKIFE